MVARAAGRGRYLQHCRPPLLGGAPSRSGSGLPPSPDAGLTPSFFPSSPPPQKGFPSIAVSAGDSIYMYRNLRPFFKFAVPQEKPDDGEVALWASAHAGQLKGPDLQRELANLKDAGVRLAPRSLDVLACEDVAAMNAMIDRSQGAGLTTPDYVSCTTTIASTEVDGAGQNLVVGTELGRLYVMDKTGTGVQTSVRLPSTPAMMCVSGNLREAYRISVASRSGNVYNVKNGKIVGNPIQLESEVVGLQRLSKSLAIACRNNTIHAYHVKGKKLFSIYLPAPVLAMELLTVAQQRQVRAVVVALQNNDLQVYHEKHLVSSFSFQEPVVGLHWGTYGREENTLISVLASGALDIKILPRSVNLEATATSKGPPPEQDIPLNVPKKTKLYVEQTQREREQAVDMHRVFQRDLCKLRLQAARNYVKVITSGEGPMSYAAGAAVRINAQVQGLGPLFKLKVSVQNTGGRILHDAFLLFHYNNLAYEVQDPQVGIPALVPGLQYELESVVRAVDPANSTGESIRAAVCSAGSTVPLLTALIKMPISELEVEET